MSNELGRKDRRKRASLTKKDGQDLEVRGEEGGTFQARIVSAKAGEGEFVLERN